MVFTDYFENIYIILEMVTTACAKNAKYQTF